MNDRSDEYDEYVEMGCDEVVAATQGAVLLEIGEEEPKWVPRSVIDGGFDLSEGDVPETVEIKRWFAEKEELI